MRAPGQALRTAPPGPRRFFMLSPLLQMRRNPLRYMEALHCEYGDIVRYRTAGRLIYMLFHPEMAHEMLVTYARHHHQGRVMQRSRNVLGNGLLTSEDAFHLRQRRLIHPAFHRQRVFGYGRAMVEYSERHQQRWRDGEVLDIHQERMRLTLSNVG